MIDEVSMHEQRKADHIRINLEEDVGFNTVTTGLEHYRFVHQALPELDLAQVNIETSFFGKKLKAPLLIASMTGGTERAQLINRYLAEAAEICGIAMGIGSQRAALEDVELVESFNIRPIAPTALLFANIGAVQLNYGYGLAHCQRAVDMIEADALILHFNALQEAVQPEGDTNFAGLYDKVEQICQTLPAPVIAKEVGGGFSQETISRLVNCGIAAIDVAGAGGTSWSQVEMHRAPTEALRHVAATFVDWGIPTSEVILNAKAVAPTLPLIASGGLKNGLDIAKCIALGASLGSMAGSFLKAAVQSLEAVIETIEVTQSELRIAMFLAGLGSVDKLRDTGCLQRSDGANV